VFPSGIQSQNGATLMGELVRRCGDPSAEPLNDHRTRRLERRVRERTTDE
jgi:hypothetical protein